MQIVLIRHGKPDYTPVDERGFIGHGRSLAPLTEEGVRQAEAAADSPEMQGVQLIVASPLTRALQTAAIISRKTGIPLTVEIDLREWEPDLTYQYKTSEESFALHQDFWACKGVYPPGETRRWESVDDIIRRTDPVYRKYYDHGYERIAVVAHGGVIRRLTGKGIVHYAAPETVEYNGSFDYSAWVD
ncbi:MAG: histidine phosphatase family protein [Clostridia bacterium]|nr:histidine phosphatase family protein [Clostridia bacterium]